MTVYTPRGLKIRLPADCCFALVSRLVPEKNAFTVLLTTEGLECIPGVLVFATGLAGFLLRLEPLRLGGYVLAASVLGSCVNKWPRVVPGLPALGTVYAVLAGRGLIMGVQVAVGLLSAGWPQVLAFYAGSLTGGALNELLGTLGSAKMTDSEVSFLDSYRLHAASVGAPTSVELADEELAEENWCEVLRDYATHCPESASRSE